MSRRVVSASLVTTVLNEAETMASFLESIAAQSAHPAEIVIVDGGSTDRTVELARAWPAPEGCEVVVVVSPGAGISAGRNTAITTAQHERILVIDAGTELSERWIEAMYDSFDAAGGVEVVSGFFYPTGASFLQRAIAFTVTPRLSEVNPSAFLPSSRSVGFTKQAWRAAGAYPEWLDYCEDLVYDLALKRTGARFVFRPDAEVSWSARPTLRAFAKQYFLYARGDGKANLWFRRHAARYLAYTVGLSLAVLSIRHPVAAVPLLVGAFAYLRKFWQRVLGRRDQFGPKSVGAAALVPLIVVVGDVAKMVGYPVGVMWRAAAHRADRAARTGTGGAE